MAFMACGTQARELTRDPGEDGVQCLSLLTPQLPLLIPAPLVSLPSWEPDLAHPASVNQ